MGKGSYMIMNRGDGHCLHQRKERKRECLRNAKGGKEGRTATTRKKESVMNKGRERGKWTESNNGHGLDHIPEGERKSCAGKTEKRAQG